VFAPHFASTTTRHRRPQVHLVRDAADFISTGRTPARLATAVKPVVEPFLRERGFARSSTKPRLTQLGPGVDFLGQTMRKDGGKFLPRPSPTRVNALLGQVRAASKAQPQARAGEVLHHRNPRLRGWATYHRQGARAPPFRKVAWHISRMLRRWASRRPPKKRAGGVGQPDFPATGPQPRVFTGKRRHHAGDVQPLRLRRRADGGGEALANLVLLHPNGHRQVHHQGWHVTTPRPVTGALSKARAGCRETFTSGS